MANLSTEFKKDQRVWHHDPTHRDHDRWVKFVEYDDKAKTVAIVTEEDGLETFVDSRFLFRLAP
jgi:hypothetical protein